MITESTRNDFCEFVYDSLSNEPDNYLTNQIIDEFDNATKNCVEWTKASDKPNRKLLLKLNNEKEKILNKYKYFSSQEQKFSNQEDFENYIEQKKEMKKGDFILKTLDTELSNLIKLVREFPTENLTRKAEWGPPSLDDFEYVNPDGTVDEDLLVCSICGNEPLLDENQEYVYSDYCPFCGAIMDCSLDWSDKK